MCAKDPEAYDLHYGAQAEVSYYDSFSSESVATASDLDDSGPELELIEDTDDAA
jgi:hypothetical protein